MSDNNNGIIYPICDVMIQFTRKYLSLVEWWKRLVCWKFDLDKLDCNKKEIAVDVFILLKFFFLALFFLFGKNPTYITISIVIYLMIFNVFTYFYYHFWSLNEILDTERYKRRFMKLSTSFLFNVLGFSYLYMNVYYMHFDNLNQGCFFQSLNIGISSTFAGSSFVTPKDDTGYWIVLVQLITTFIYVTLLIANTLPQINNSDNDPESVDKDNVKESTLGKEKTKS